MQNNEMFTRLKVVELASVLAGPSVGQFFAELGAEVIKVENLRLGGDVTRTWKGSKETSGNISAYFSSVNWGKKSIAIDLSNPEGKEIIQKLVQHADIVIASYKRGDAEKLGVDYGTFSILNPSLIYGQITGYGSNDDRVGYDAVIQAESGFMDLNGEKGGQPLKMPVALIDVLAAHHLKEAILVSMINRQYTGVGGLVEVSLLQAAISSLANQAANYLVANALPARQGSIHPNIAPYGENFETKDEKRVLLAIGNDRQFQDLCKICGLDQLSSHSLFVTNPLRVKNRVELGEHLKMAISKLDSTKFISLCHQHKIPAGIIQNLEEVFESDEAKEILLQSNNLSGVRNLVFRYHGNLSEVSHILPPPAFGEHTGSILAENVGLSVQEIELLRQKGIIN